MSTPEELQSEAQLQQKQDEFESNLECPQCKYNGGYIDRNNDEFHCPSCEYRIHSGRYWNELKRHQLADF